MTAPAVHRPTPADLARRTPKPAAAPQPPAPKQEAEPRLVRAEDTIRPGKLRKPERLRAMFEHGMRISRMHPEARLLGLTLLGYANFQTGQIHPRWRPTPEELSYATGLSTGQVRVQVEVLTSRGWLAEHTLRQGPRAGSAALQLCVPAAVLQQLRDRAAARAEAAAEASETSS